METPRDAYETALAGSALGLRLIPCRPGTKVPLVKWKQYQGEPPTPEEYRRWFEGTRNNIAVLTSGMVLFDCDDPAKAELVTAHCGETPWKVRTPRGGVHLAFRRRQGVSVTNQVKVKGEPIDVRTDGGLALIPPSVTEQGRYEWLGDGLLSVSDLPLARIGWTRERSRKRVVQSIASAESESFLEYRASRWLQKVAQESPAVSGQGGHNATFRVACKLTCYFGLGRETAIRLLLTVYNPHCRPPWTLREIEHKVDDALKKRG